MLNFVVRTFLIFLWWLAILLDSMYINQSIMTTTSNILSRRVKDKIIIITGCNSPLGIGRASAHHFANNGAKAIYICDLATDHLDKHKREIESKYPGVAIHPVKLDAGEEKDVEKVVNDALEEYGRLGKHSPHSSP